MHKPAPTKRTLHAWGDRPVMAWCPACQAFMPAAQVPFGQERRDSLGNITATYAAIPHEGNR